MSANRTRRSTTQLFVQSLKTPEGVSLTAAQGLVCTLENQPDPSVFPAVRDAEEHTEDLAVREYLIRALGDTKNPAALARPRKTSELSLSDPGYARCSGHGFSRRSPGASDSGRTIARFQSQRSSVGGIIVQQVLRFHRPLPN